ncbi:MAG: DUF4097 family beta strand repeat protein [Candidatus Krumholzibacteriota bacterium]|nr:DUF4097 family beta strand repeat protein [Candidatus Krumholzibacteriota bacterium]
MRHGTEVIGAKAALFLVAAAIVFVPTGAAASYRHEKTSDVAIPREGAMRLFVRTMLADVVITGSADARDIKLRIVRKVTAEDEAKAKEIAEELEVRIDNDGEEIHIGADIPENREKDVNVFNFVFRRRTRIDMTLELTVPADLDIEIETASGDVIAVGVDGRLQATTASGDIEIERTRGELELESASGDVTVVDAAGAVDIGTASGDIAAEKVGGDVNVSSATGDIELEDIAKDLALTSISGDVSVDGVRSVSFSTMNGDARFRNVRGGVRAKAASGDVALDLAPEEDSDYAVRTSSGSIDLNFITIMPGGFILKAETTTGDITVSLPINITKVGRNRILGVVREGARKIVLETASGNISISEPEE